MTRVIDDSILCETKSHTFRFDFNFFAHHLLHKSWMGYLAYIFDTKTSDVRLEDVSMIWDFFDVFLDELPRWTS